MDENSKENNGLPVVEDTGGQVVENTPVRVQSPEVQRGSNPPQKARRGRPPGAKNKDTLFKELMAGRFQEIAAQNIEKTFEKLFEEAHDGNMQAIKLIMDRVVPSTKAVDLEQLEKKGLTINISVGNLEDSVSDGVRSDEEPIEGEFTEVE